MKTLLALIFSVFIREPQPPPPMGYIPGVIDFTTNGCSTAPNGIWRHCCYEHDFLYWVGGGFAARKSSDERLRTCINDSGGFGDLYYDFVRVQGAVFFNGAWPNQNLNVLTQENLETIYKEKALWTKLGSPARFDFVHTESLLFNELTENQKQMVIESFNEYVRINYEEYQKFRKTYLEYTGREPITETYLHHKSQSIYTNRN